ncbi:MAG: methylated-DNA--[protein]-cysteine S-methyltransferase [Spirochaetia bacterium]|nr:methylated-DNA--[protein]-cysteine S-methyltransferase [Spirochaetia bacterium]
MKARRPASDSAPIVMARMDSPLGPIMAGVRGGRLCYLDFADRPAAGKGLSALAAALATPVRDGRETLHDRLEAQLAEYFGGRRRSFDIELELNGTAFQKDAWKALAAIPYGTTVSYAQEARSLGRPAAVRAVAQANARNPVAILVPCHRVVASDGGLGGYSGGLERKKFLLELEKGTA